MPCEICGYMPKNANADNGHTGVCVQRMGMITPTIEKQIKEGITEICRVCRKYKPVGCFCWWCKN